MLRVITADILGIVNIINIIIDIINIINITDIVVEIGKYITKISRDRV